MLRPGTFALTVLLGMLAAVGPMSVDMYLPSLPEIGRSLNASVPQVQLTLSGFLLLLCRRPDRLWADLGPCRAQTGRC